MKKILDRVNPNFALVSTGSENTYKHPLPEVIKAIVTHGTGPRLFCTQMTDKCSKNRHRLKEKVEEFYRRKISQWEYDVLKLGNDTGVMCAGTIRITFDLNSRIQSVPSPQQHFLMLKKYFSTEPLLCRSRV
jgi:hypothetical protein